MYTQKTSNDCAWVAALIAVFVGSCEPTSAGRDAAAVDAFTDANVVDAVREEAFIADVFSDVNARTDVHMNPDHQVLASSCDEISAQECFSNFECASSQACHNVSTLDQPATCCVEAQRGTLTVGEICDEDWGELQCASAICIGSGADAYCSTTCTGDDECPAQLPRCLPIAFSGSPDNWCLP